MFQILGNYRKQQDKTQRVSTLTVASSVFRFQPCHGLAMTLCRKITQSSEIQFAHPTKGMKKESESESHSVVSSSLSPHGLQCPWNSPGQNTGMGSLSLLQRIFLIKGSNPGLPHCRQILYQLSHKRSPRILEWGSLFPSPGDLPDPGIEPGSPALQADSLPTELFGKALINKRDKQPSSGSAVLRYK